MDKSIMKRYKLYLFVCMTLIIAFSCSEEERPEKILLVNKSEEVEEQSIETQDVIAAEISFTTIDQKKPAILILPFTTQVNNDFSWIEKSITNIQCYILSQYKDLYVYPQIKMKKFVASSGEEITDEILNKILQNELISHYVRCSLNQRNNIFTLHYAVYDSQSHVSLFDEYLTANSIDGIAENLNLTAEKIHDILINIPDSDFSPINTPFRALHLFVQGEEASQLLDIETARTMYSESLNEDPTFAKVYVNYISLYFQNFTDMFHTLTEPLFHNAYRYIEKLSEKEKIQLSAYKNFYFKKYKESLSNFETLAQKYPNSPKGIIGIIRLFLTLNIPEQAVEALSEQRDVFSDNIPLLRIKHEVYNRLGKFNISLNTIKEYQNLTNNSIYSLLDEAQLLYTWGREIDALSVLEKILSIDPNNFTAILLSGEIYFDHMIFQKSIESYQQAISSLPTEQLDQSRDLYEQLFLSYVYSGQFSVATSIADLLINREYGSRNFKSTLQLTTYLSLLNQALEKESNLSHAISSLLEIQIPDFQLSRLLTLISAKSNQENYQRVFNQAAQKIRRINNYQFQLLQNLNRGYKDWYNGNYDIAINNLITVLNYEYNAIISYHLCKAYIELGQLKNAENEIQRFFTHLIIEDFEHAYVLPFFYIAQAELFEKKGDTAAAGQLYSNLNTMWNFADDQLSTYKLVKNKLSSLSLN